MIAFAGVVLSLALPFPEARAAGWSKDGAVFGVSAVARVDDGFVQVLYLFDPSGAPKGSFQVERALPSGATATEAVEAAWAAAGPSAEGARLMGSLNPGLKASRLTEISGEVPVDERTVIRFATAGGDRCAPVKMSGSEKAVSRTLADDPCPDGAGPSQRNELDIVPSPDGKKTGLVWMSVRRLADGSEVSRAHVAVVSHRVLASVDLLDAGASPGRLTEIGEAVTRAGLPIGHRGKALAKRPRTAVFYNEGFAAEAAEIGRLAGAEPAPLTFKSPFAITVAVGAGR